MLIAVYIARVFSRAPRAFGWACVVCMLAPPLNFLYVAIVGKLERLKRSLSGFVLMLSDSFMTSSMVCLGGLGIEALLSKVRGYPFCSRPLDRNIQEIERRG